MKKNEKEYQDQKDLREKQESAVLHRVLLWLCVTVILEAYVLLTNRFYIVHRIGELDMLPTIERAIQISQFVFLGLCVIFGAWAIWAARKQPGKGVTRSIVAAMFGAAAVCSFLFLRTGASSITVLQVAIPVMGVLILIYYLYQKEFFVLSVLSTVGIFGLWLFRAWRISHPAVFFSYLVVALIVVAACAFFLNVLRKREGTISILGKARLLLQKDAVYSPVFFTCVLVAALMLIPLIAGNVFAYYAIFALIIWIFIMAVYFTAKLM